MIPSLRQPFNDQYSPDKYQRFLGILEQRFGEPPPFRHSETPCFLPEALVVKAAQYGREMVEQLLANRTYLDAAESAVPVQLRVPNETPVPLFVQADFGLDENGGWKLVEIQGFPSLYAYQPVLADAYREAYAIDGSLVSLLGEMTREDYKKALSQAIVGTHDPEQVVLLEVDPARQKTRHDFSATEDLLGVRTVDALKVSRNGKQLSYSCEGRQIPIRRIYNRVIADELDRRGLQLPFDWRDDLNVEWAGHPNWFYKLSKFSLPYLDHPAVPRSWFLNEVTQLPADPAHLVLKPLYSFAGAGVIVGPTAEQINAVPPSHREKYLLQERVHFVPSIDTPEGPTKLELRVMYVWRDSMEPLNLVLRMGRGAQMGVDHNKDLGWVGASAAFIQKESETA